MIVDSDTGPLNYAILIECTHVLPAMYGTVYIPHEVARELRDTRSPAPVLNWMSAPPSWLIERAPAPFSPLPTVDLGEAAAISLAQELKAELLRDDMKARKIAAGLGLKTVCLLGLLRAAASRDLIDLIPMLDRLETTSFFAPRDLLEAMRAEARRRHNG